MLVCFIILVCAGWRNDEASAPAPILHSPSSCGPVAGDDAHISPYKLVEEDLELHE